MSIAVVTSIIMLTLLSSPTIHSSLAPTAWPMFHQNAQHTGLSPNLGPTDPFLKWKFKTGGAIHSSPAIGRGRIYVGSEDGSLYALNFQGVLLWKFQTGSPLRTSPAIASDGTIYLGSNTRPGYSGNLGIVYALDPGGNLKWNTTIAPLESDGSLSSPTIGPDGTVYVSSIGFRIVALYPDGTLKWNVNTHGEVFSSPALAPDGTVYVGIDDPDPSGVCGQCLIAINPDGTVKWTNGYTSNIQYSSPAVGADGTVYVSGGDGFFAINPDGTVKWKYSGEFSTPSIGPDGTIYASGDRGLFAFDPNGTLRWDSPNAPPAGYCTPSGYCQVTFVAQSDAAIGSDGMVYFGNSTVKFVYGSPPTITYAAGNLYAVNPDGTLTWKFTTGPIPSLASVSLGSDRTLYFGSADGNVYAITSDHAGP